MIHANSGRGVDHCHWFAELTFSGAVSPPLRSQNQLHNAVSTALNDQFWLKTRAGKAPETRPVVLDFDFPAFLEAGIFEDIVPITTFEEACDAIASDYSVIAKSQNVFAPVRDKYGFCAVSKVAENWCVFRGISDNGRRPALIQCGPTFPAGHLTPKLPHGVRFILPEGCFFVDAELTPKAMWAVT